MEPDRVCNSRATRVEPHRVRATAYALPEGGHTYGKGCVKDPEDAGNGEWRAHTAEASGGGRLGRLRRGHDPARPCPSSSSHFLRVDGTGASVLSSRVRCARAWATPLVALVLRIGNRGATRAADAVSSLASPSRAFAPPSSFTSHRPTVMQKWVHSTPSEPKESQRSFVKTNSLALKEGCITAKAQRAYAQDHPDIRFKQHAYTKAEPPKPPYMGPYGVPTSGCVARARWCRVCECVVREGGARANKRARAMQPPALTDHQSPPSEFLS